MGGTVRLGIFTSLCFYCDRAQNNAAATVLRVDSGCNCSGTEWRDS